MRKINLIPEFNFGTFAADKDDVVRHGKGLEEAEGRTVTGVYFRWIGLSIFVGKKNFVELSIVENNSPKID